MHWKQFTFIVCVLFFVVATSTFAQDLIVKSVSVSTASVDYYTANLDGPNIKFSFTSSNIGNDLLTNVTFWYGIYLSTDQNITTSDYLIYHFSKTGPWGGGYDDIFTNLNIAIKDNPEQGWRKPANGSYYLGVIVDFWGPNTYKIIRESNENNNTKCDATRQVLVQYPNLKGNSLTGVSVSDRTITASYSIRNDYYPCSKDFKVNFYLSSVSNNTTIEKTDYLIGSINWTTNLSANSTSALQPVTLNASSVPEGAYFLGICVDANDDVIESIETDNTYALSQTPNVIIMATPGIRPVSSATSTAGSNFFVYINLGVGIPVNNILGVSGTLEYTFKNYINYAGTFYYNYPSGLGLSSEVIATHSAEEPPGEPGKIHFAIARKGTGKNVGIDQHIMRFTMQSLASTPAGIPVEFSLKNIQGVDPYGNPVPLALTPASYTVVITSVSQAKVWPGDTNNDGYCNLRDLLPIGTYWQKTGPNRTCHSITAEDDWMQHTVNRTGTQSTPAPAPQWNPWPAAALADADGNGSVGDNDVTVLNANRGKTHDLPPTSLIALAKMTTQGILRPIINTTLAANQEFWIELQAENVDALFGLAFDLKYPVNTRIEALAVEPGSWLGEDILTLSNIDPTAEMVNVAVTRKAGQESLQGSGIVARIKMKTLADYVSTDVIQFNLDNIIANDQDGNSYTLTAEALELTGVNNSHNFGIPEKFGLYANYPNPFNPATHIAYDLPQELKVRIEVFDLLGRQVCTLVDETKQAGKYIVTWNGRDQSGKVVSSGIYMYRITAGTYSATRTMVFLP